MISLSLDWFLLAVLGAGLLALVMLWVPQLWFRHPHRWSNSELQICRCPKCHYSFFVPPQQNQAACPACKERFRIRCRGNFLRY
jgi:hypothetical protein